MNRVVFVPSHFLAFGKHKSVAVPTGEKKLGFFGGEKEVTKTEKQWVQTGSSDCEIDAPRLAKDIELAVAGLNDEGYEVVTITPLTSGKYDFKYETGFRQWGYGYGYGYSYTTGVVITARKAAATT